MMVRLKSLLMPAVSLATASAICLGSGAAAQDAPSGSGSPAEFAAIEAPAEQASGVFIEQVGTTNRAEVNQASASGAARILQDGSGNQASLNQGELGQNTATLAQAGDDNSINAAQNGSGSNLLLLAQEGNGNSALVSQTDSGLLYSAAAILQSGNGNSLALVQDGDDNQARLTQNGDNNAMTAVQLDTGNRLEWTQDGSGLSDLQITQTGGAAMQVTQTNGGGGN